MVVSKRIGKSHGECISIQGEREKENSGREESIISRLFIVDLSDWGGSKIISSEFEEEEKRQWNDKRWMMNKKNIL